MIRSILTTAIVLSTATTHAATYHIPALDGGTSGEQLPIAFRYDLTNLRGNIVSAEVPFGGVIKLGLPERTYDVEVRDSAGTVYGSETFAPGLGDPGLDPLPGEPLGWANDVQQPFQEDFQGWAWWGQSVYTKVALDVPMIESARQTGEVHLWFHQAGGPSWEPWLCCWPLLVETDAPAGDFNNNGLVEQGDLDLVLGNWGKEPTPVWLFGAKWINDRPAGIAAQAQLDQVLTAWGQGVTITAAGVPEPATIVILVITGGILCVRYFWLQRA